MRTWTWLWIAAAGVLGLSGRAAAQECESDADCVKGYACEVVGASGCGFACSSEDPDCAPPPDFMCEETEYKACVPGPCSSDSDCEDGMVCFEFEAYDCPVTSDIDCAPGEECTKPEPVPCEPSTTSQCVPQYAVPCSEAADCGDGFDCVEDIEYACSGSSPSAGSGGEDPGDPRPAPEPIPAPEEVSCTEKPLGTFHCEAQEVACESDSDCPSEWTCGENWSRPVCSDGAMTEPAPAPPAPSEACPDAIPELCRTCEGGECGKPVCVDGGWTFVCPEDEAATDPGEPVPPPADEPVPPADCGIDTDVPERVCQPPFSDLGWGGFATADAAESGVAGGTGAPLADPQAPGATPEPGRDDGAAEEVSDGDKASFGDGESAPEPKADSGCAVSAPGQGAGHAAGFLPVLGLGLFGLWHGRRRRHS